MNGVPGDHAGGPLLSVAQLAARWGWKPAKIYRLCADQRIPHVRIGGQLFFEDAALDAWIDAHRVGTKDVSPREAERRGAQRTRDEECRLLGIEATHEFS
jgi:excisionase family DNA binding protein